MILRCDCRHPVQDSFHGYEKRVHNPCRPKEQTPWFRCTVCQKERQKGKVS